MLGPLEDVSPPVGYYEINEEIGNRDFPQQVYNRAYKKKTLFAKNRFESVSDQDKLPNLKSSLYKSVRELSKPISDQKTNDLKPDKECPSINGCANLCMLGYAKDSDGCKTCKCITSGRFEGDIDINGR